MPTTPRGIISPDGTKLWKLTDDLQTMADTTDAAIAAVPINCLVGTDAARDAIAEADLFDGLKFHSTDTGLDWIYRDAWFIAPGQVLGEMYWTTTVVGTQLARVGGIVTTPKLPIGQRVKICASYSQFANQTGPVSVRVAAHNGAEDVSPTVFTKSQVTRGYSASSAGVHDSVTPSFLLTTGLAERVSAAIYLNSPTSGVFGADGVSLWIEAA